MIGELPSFLIVNNKQRAIRSDFRTALIIFQAFNDIELNEYEKTMVLLKCLYVDFKEFTEAEYREAIDQACIFLDGGKEYSSEENKSKVIDWEQDEQMIFSAINKVAGCETRAKRYIHWWTFLGYFNEIGEGLLSTVINIRQKKSKGKKLEKYEQDFYRNNKDIINLKQKYTQEEQKEIDRLNSLLN